jgi:hypothetical protein
MSEDTTAHDRHHHPPHNGDDHPNVEVSVHVSAPTSAAFDNVYREQASATLNFKPANRIHIGSISWPPQRVFIVDENEQKELASWGSQGVVVSPLLKRKDREGSPEDQKRPAKHRIGCQFPPLPQLSGTPMLTECSCLAGTYSVEQQHSTCNTTSPSPAANTGAQNRTSNTQQIHRDPITGNTSGSGTTGARDRAARTPLEVDVYRTGA